MRDLRQKYGHPFNLADLAEGAKRDLREEGLPLTPNNFRRAAEQQASAMATMEEELSELSRSLDYRALMDGRVNAFLQSGENMRAEKAREEALLMEYRRNRSL